MKSTTRRGGTPRVLYLLAPALLVLSPLAAHQIGSAAQLDVSAAPLQTWLVNNLPAVDVPAVPPTMPVPEVCGEADAYDEVIVGTADNDRLEGVPGKAEVFIGDAGDDQISGNNKDDCLVGGAGDDMLEGGPGDDILDGGPGDDVLDGGPGSDTFSPGGDPGDECIDGHGPDALGPDCKPAPTSPSAGGPAPSASAPQDAADSTGSTPTTTRDSEPVRATSRSSAVSPSDPAESETPGGSEAPAESPSSE